MHIVTLYFIIALVKHGLLPQIWPKYVSNTINCIWSGLAALSDKRI
jgi:hypothetical protein